MRVYLHSDRAERAVCYPLRVAPAADVEFVNQAGVDVSQWKNTDGHGETDLTRLRRWRRGGARRFGALLDRARNCAA
jgi:hypothetical protein